MIDITSAVEQEVEACRGCVSRLQHSESRPQTTKSFVTVEYADSLALDIQLVNVTTTKVNRDSYEKPDVFSDVVYYD